MEILYGFKINWEDFWNNQENNPNAELSFMYRGNYYVLIHEDYKWCLCTLGVEDGEFYIDTSKNVIISVPEKNYGHRNYYDDDNWNDSINACYKLLTMPFIDGKSFKDIIEDIEFEY